MTASFDPLAQSLTGFWSIAASAGTGKTYSISILWLRLILAQGVPVEAILVNTFTEAATAELRDRLLAIASAARDHLLGLPCDNPAASAVIDHLRHDGTVDDDSLARRLGQALSAFDTAPISTIHGFCHRLLDAQALELACDPEAELVSDHTRLIDRLVDDWLMRHADLPDLDPAQIRPLAQALWRQTGIGRDQVLPPPLTELADDASLAAAVAAARDHCIRAIGAGADLAGRLRSQGITGAGGTAVRKRLEAVLDGAPAIPLSAKGGAQLAQQLPGLHAAFQDLLSAQERQTKIPTLRQRAALIDDLFAELPPRCRAAGQRSFDDLLVTVRDALRAEGAHGPLAQAVRQRYQAVIIDECQDSDAVQIEVFTRLFIGSRPQTPAVPTVLVIGDPKQSIYRFRGADLSSYTHLTGQARQAPQMTVNHRSDAALVTALDRLYQAHHRQFSGPDGPIPYVPVTARHQTTRLHDPACDRGLAIVFEPQTGRAAATNGLARQVARECRRLLAGPVRLDEAGQARRLRADDIAVLAHNHRHLRLVRRALQDVGIPVQQAGRGLERVLASDEALDWQLWLEALAALDGDRGALLPSLLTHAAGPLSGLPADVALQLGDDVAGVDALQDQLLRQAILLRRHGPLPLLLRVLHHRVGERVLAHRDGERRLTNWRHIGALLHEGWISGQRRPVALLDLLRQLRASENDQTLQRLETDRPAVQLVTVHASKGLEYPVVFCPYLWHCPSRQQKISHMRVAVLRRGGDSLVDGGGEDFKQHCAEAFAQEREEQQRSCYVALTRARLRCYIGLAPVDDGGRSHDNGAHKSPVAQLLDLHTLPLENWANRLADDIIRPDVEDPTPADDQSQAPEPAPPPPITPGGHRVCCATSFSGLHAGHHHRVDDRDEDADQPQPAGQPGLLEGLGGGVGLGTRLHDLLERILGDGLDIDAALSGQAQDDQPRLAAVLESLLRAPIAGPGLPAGLDLRRLAVDAIAEMPFLLPLGGLDGTRLAQALLADSAIAADPANAAWAGSWAQRGLGPIAGFLSGFIDLLGIVDERWYVIDYKTNLLPDYGPDALAQAMRAHDYLLQQQLYQLALDRHLARHLGPAYDPARHLGGSLYLFVRGLPEQGLWYTPANGPGLAALDALMGSRPPPHPGAAS